MVEKVVRAAEITLLPKAPEIVVGVVNWQGRVVPVVNMRARFGLTAREFDFTDTEACLTWLLSSSLSRRQIEVLASHLTVGETCFFRDSNLV